MLRNKILSLLLCLLMMCAAAICVNKALFGHSLSADAVADQDKAPQDTITLMANGTSVVHTALLTDAKGYAGPVPLDIYIRDGKITDILPLENAESPGFFGRAKAMLEDWIGKSPAEGAALKVDGVTGATYSSQAIKSNMEAGLDYYLKAPKDSRQAERMPWKMWVALGVTLAACLLPLFVKNRLYNNVQLIANVIVLGFWCGQFLDYSLMLRYLSDGISLPAGLTAIAMLAAAFIFPLFGRAQHYCNHVCPLGSAQMLVASICHYKIHIPQGVLKGLDWFRKILWAALMLLLWTDTLTGWMDLELFQVFLPESASVGIIVAAVLFVALSAVISRPYCRFVCPTGSLIKCAENM